MTPIEKSQQLINLFRPHADWNNEYGSSEEGSNVRHAKECAIICVEQIIPCTWKRSTYKKEGKIWVDEITTTEYWEEVLNHLKNS